MVTLPVELTVDVRIYALALCRDRPEADIIATEILKTDLAQKTKTLDCGLARMHLLKETRHLFHSRCHSRNCVVPAVAEDVFSSLYTDIFGSSAFSEQKNLLRAILGLLPDDSEAFILMTFLGQDQNQAARICDCDVDTIIRRVNCATALLQDKFLAFS